MIRLNKDYERQILIDNEEKIEKEIKESGKEKYEYLKEKILESADDFSEVCTYLYKIQLSPNTEYIDDKKNNDYYSLIGTCNIIGYKYFGSRLSSLTYQIVLNQRQLNEVITNEPINFYEYFCKIVPLNTYMTRAIISALFILYKYEDKVFIPKEEKVDKDFKDLYMSGIIHDINDFMSLYNGTVYYAVYHEKYDYNVLSDIDHYLLNDDNYEELNKKINSEIETHILYWRKFITFLMVKDYKNAVNLVKRGVLGDENN